MTPAFVDPHTHLFPSKDRAADFSLRSEMSYQEIANKGGGINSSVEACRAATFEELYSLNEQLVRRFIAQGTLTLEIKSGYGLDVDSEIKLLRVIKALRENYKRFIEIVPTFMGAHDFPKEFAADREGYVDLVVNKMIPAVAKEKGLAEFCDVFCESGWFSAEQAEKILRAARQHKFKLRIHADEFQDSKAA